jgi:DNA gyrase inhibitor GyrI
LADLYAPGASFWRVSMPHFSSWDSNMGISPPQSATAAKTNPPRITRRQSRYQGCVYLQRKAPSSSADR